MRTTTFYLSLLLLFCSNLLQAQSSAIRGVVLDRQSETPLVGATVRLMLPENTQPIGTTTDANGVFVLRNVPTGRQQLLVTYLGYDDQTASNILVTSGKEVALDIRLEERLNKIEGVVITAKVDKDKAINEMATISARQFDTEAVRRFSGGRNDVAKLVANFAGVAANNDARNDIIIRGNAPTGVLWRLEGIPIPNPNHYSTLGTTGGPVSALNPNMIANSDFLTGAFPAEYGNAMAGVFDINLRTGNKERFEFTGQLGAFSGLEAMVEGPVNQKQNGSFVVAYRHSFAEIAQATGLNVGTTATPKYKDLTFNLDFGQGKAGKWSLFGIGGHSNIDFIGADLDTTDLFANPNENAYNISKFGVLGLKNNLLLNDKSYIRTVLSVSYSGNSYKSEDVSEATEQNGPFKYWDVADNSVNYRLSSFYNNKINSRLTLRTGMLLQRQQLSSAVSTRQFTPDLDGDGVADWFKQRDFDGHFDMGEWYAQSLLRITERLTLNTGLHALYFAPTKDVVAEPRVAVNWEFAPKQSLNLGYGLHHQTQSLPVFLYRTPTAGGGSREVNNQLGFTRSQHFVLAYSLKPASDWRIKAEAYTQLIDRVPVDTFASSFSMLNTGADFVFPERGPLVNAGTGNNIGIELTAEKFFSRGYYSLLTVSLFEAQYKGSDGVRRSTAFDGGYVVNLLAGKEINLGQSGRRVLTFDTKLTAAGGRPYTPVNLAASRAAGKEVLYEDQAYSLRLDDYFRWDVKMGIRLNSPKKKLSQTFFLDFQNVTNNDNIFAMRYNTVRGEVGRVNQIGFFPDVLYRIEF